MKQSVAVSDAHYSRAAGIAKTFVERLGVSQEAARPLERFVSVYESVRSASDSHDAALAIAARDALRSVEKKSVARIRCSYPQTPSDVLRIPDYSPRAFASYCAFVHDEAQQRSRESKQAPIVFGGTTYVFMPIEQQRQMLIGLDKERKAMDDFMRCLFAYEPRTLTNQRADGFPRALLLAGPPGTGKSSLLREAFMIGEDLAATSNIPFRTEVYDASNFSMYFGKSTKILRRMLDRVSDPSGVGLFVIEDADMVLQSRDDPQVSHGVLELQQYLMNHLSGLRNGAHATVPNTMTFLTTNRTGRLSDALRNRVEEYWHVDPFVERSAHEAYFAAQAPRVSERDRAGVAAQTHEHALTGRDLAAIVKQARRAACPVPTDEELAARMFAAGPYEVASAELLRSCVADRIAARRS